MRRRPALLLIGALGLLLIGVLAVGGLTVWMGDDDGAEGRRSAAFGEDDPGDPTEKPSGLTLSLTVVGPGDKAGIDKSLARGVRELPGFGQSSNRACMAAVAPGRTCHWGYSLCNGCSGVEMVLDAYPVAGTSTRVIWSGCVAMDKRWQCLAQLREHYNPPVKATFYD